MTASPSSGVGSLRRRQGIATRAHILKTAEGIFAEVGLHGARTDAIAAHAGVNKALLYYYFKSKDALFHAVLEEHLKDFHQGAFRILSEGGSPATTLMRYVTFHFDFISARPYYPALFQRLLLTGGKPLENLARKHIGPVSRKLIGVIKRGVRQGEFRSVDCAHTAISVAGLTVFYFSSAPVVRLVRRVDPYSPAQLERRKDEVLNFIRHALFRHPEVRAS